MMVGVQQLREARPEMYEAGARIWDERAVLLEGQLRRFRDRVLHSITQPSVWSGVAARGAERRCNDMVRVQQQVVDQHHEIATVLGTAGAEIAGAQQVLRSAEAMAAQDGLTVRADGYVLPVPGAPPPEDPTRQQQAVDEVVSEVQKALDQATEADRRAADALNARGEVLPDASVVADQQRDTEQDARRAAELARLGDDLDPEQQAELLHLMEAGAGDAVFATEFLETLGAQGTLQLGTDIAALALDEDDPQTIEQLRRLQARLGETLATGTHERSEPQVDRRWVNQLMEAGRREIPHSPYQNYSPYGYQVLGSLLHSGDYSAEFLNQVGDDMLAMENEDPDVFRGREARLAANGQTELDLNLLDDRTDGYDPLVGLMGAMDRNPDAGTQFFDPQQHEGRLQYLLEDRVWPPGHLVYAGDHGQSRDDMPDAAKSIGYDRLGHALEAASLEGPRTEAHARIASGVVEVLGDTDAPADRSVGQHPELIPQALQDSVGNIVAGYMPDVNEAMQGRHVIPDGFRVDAEQSYPGAERIHASFDQSNILRVMDSAAHDPNGYRAMYDAETMHTALRLNDIAANPSVPPDQLAAKIAEEAGYSANVFGALDESKAWAVDTYYDGEDARYNARMEQQGRLMGVAAGGLAAGIPGALGGLAGSGSGLLIDEMVTAARQDSSNIVVDETSERFSDGRYHARMLAEQAMLQHGLTNPGAGAPPAELLTGGPGSPATDMATWTHDQWKQYDDWNGGETTDRAGYPINIRETVERNYSHGARLVEEQIGHRFRETR